MHDAVHSSGGSSRRPTLKPHHFTDSKSPEEASWMGTAICTHLQPLLPTGPAAGEGLPAFENGMRYLNLSSLLSPRAQFPPAWSTVWVTCVRPRVDRRHDHLLVRSMTALDGEIGARILTCV